jgi:hypothetical protein
LHHPRGFIHFGELADLFESGIGFTLSLLVFFYFILEFSQFSRRLEEDTDLFFVFFGERVVRLLSNNLFAIFSNSIT